MTFRTKLDFSDNRQVKQHIETLTVLSGATNFGVPFNTLPVGPNLLTTGITESYINVVSTFSGNSASTIYSWYHPVMEYAITSLSALTPSNSGTTQEVIGFSGNSYTIIDGNSIALGYSGTSYDLLPIAMYDLGSGNYSGSVYTQVLEILSASTLDFTGRTIWADVSGITRTEDLIITKNPSIGNVWTCVDSEGKGAWASSSGSSGTTLWSAGTGTYSLVPKNHNAIASGDYSLAVGDGSIASGIGAHAEGYSTLANGDYSHAQGYSTLANGDYSHAQGFNTVSSGQSSHAGGAYTIANGTQSFVHGLNSKADGEYSIVLGRNITGSTADTTYVDQFNVKTIGSAAFVNDVRIDANGNLTTNTSDIRFKENITPLEGALDKIKKLNGVTYQWKDKNAGGDDFKIGFIAQEVEIVEPLLVFTNKHDGYKGIHIDGIIPLLVEAIKEITSGNNSILETQTIVAEDNNIELNYNGSIESSIGGGIRVLRGEDVASELSLDENGDWITNNGFKPKNIIIPSFSPSSSNDEFGKIGNLTQDENYLYIKTTSGWKRTNLESF
jgi:hypothetical protein